MKLPINYFLNRKILERELLSTKYLFFNLLVTTYYKKQDQKINARYLQYLQEKKYNTNLRIPIEVQTKTEQIVNLIKEKLSDYKEKYFNKKNSEFDFLEKENSEKVKTLISVKKKFLLFLQYYNESLENIVEGQREVLSNENFKFEDGETAKEKELALEEFFNKFKTESMGEIKKNLKF